MRTTSGTWIHCAGLGPALALAATLAIGAPTARALSITGITLTLDAANSANATGTSGANQFQIASSLALSGPAPVSVADVVGASVSFETRYAALLAADREAVGGTSTRTASPAYSISFVVDNPLGAAYQLDIDTRRIGAVVVVDDGSGTASASLGAVAAQVDGVAEANLSLGALSGGAQVISQSSTTLSLLDSALSRTVTLQFSWSSSATSSRDEVAVLLGLAGSLPNTIADDYPGPTARDATKDGHFVGVRATILSIPEPGTAILVAQGFVALALRRRAQGRRARGAHPGPPRVHLQV